MIYSLQPVSNIVGFDCNFKILIRSVCELRVERLGCLTVISLFFKSINYLLIILEGLFFFNQAISNIISNILSMKLLPVSEQEYQLPK